MFNFLWNTISWPILTKETHAVQNKEVRHLTSVRRNGLASPGGSSYRDRIPTKLRTADPCSKGVTLPSWLRNAVVSLARPTLKICRMSAGLRL